MDIFFLAPIYIIAMTMSGIFIGLVFDKIVQYVGPSGALFVIFATSQLIFRIVLNEEPGRLVGQIFYFVFFLVVVKVVNRIKIWYLHRNH